jgi:hypothetical protein
MKLTGATKLPLNSNGKLELRRIAVEPEADGNTQDGALAFYAMPRSNLYETIIWLS